MEMENQFDSALSRAGFEMQIFFTVKWSSFSVPQGKKPGGMRGHLVETDTLCHKGILGGEVSVSLKSWNSMNNSIQ